MSQTVWVILAVLLLFIIAAVLLGDDDDDAPERVEPPAAAEPEQSRGQQEQPAARPAEQEAEQEQAPSSGAEPPAADDPDLLARLKVAPESDGGVDYERSDYLPGGWGDADGDGCNTREEVLIAEARMLTRVDLSCRPLDGSWWSWYDERTLDDAGQIDIDHMVPLAEAHRSGAWSWPAARRVEFANDLSEPAALAAVSAGSNRAKGARDPAEWRPPARAAWCQYAQDWITVKVHWELAADRAEVSALRRMLETCPAGRAPRPAEQLDRRIERVDVERAPSSAPIGRRAVYDSCEQAAAAGEPREQGRSGSGRGFAQSKVPSARDGDSDGVVCER